MEISPNYNDSSYISTISNLNTSERIYDVFEENDVDPSKILNDLRIKNINRLVIGHLNVNSVERKFESLKEVIQGNIDILVLSETKLDESYSTNMFDIEGYTLPFRRDRNINGGGVLIYVKEGIPCRELKMMSATENVEGIFLEINLRKRKWLLFGGYNNCKSNISAFLSNIGPTIDYYMRKLVISIPKLVKMP